MKYSLKKAGRKKLAFVVEIIPGVSAINSCASLLGAPIMHDSCTISLSDHLTPWDLIAKRVDAAAQADFVIALYNPRVVVEPDRFKRHREPITIDHLKHL